MSITKIKDNSDILLGHRMSQLYWLKSRSGITPILNLINSVFPISPIDL